MQKTNEPRQLATGGVRDAALAAKRSGSDHTAPAGNAEDFRAAFIARRYRLSGHMARAIAALAFVATTAACQTPPAPIPATSMSAYGLGFAAVRKAALAHDVPVNLALAVAKVESGGNCRARSSHNAIGIMQVLPATARGEGVSGSLVDCDTGAVAGVRYLRRAIETHGAGCAGMSAYNHGLHARARCTGYGRRVLALSGGGA
jgi:soluble lytic murein transglycosylase-like protein